MTGKRPGRAAVRLLAGLAGALCLSVLPALAQTSVNPGALDQLAPPPATAGPTHSAPPRRPARRTTRKPTRQTAPRKPAAAPAKPEAAAKPATTKPATTKTPPAKPAPSRQAGSLVVPLAPPPPPVLPPPIIVPIRPPPPPPPVPIVADAPGEAMAQKDGLRVTFGVGRADLNPATDATLRALAHAAPPFTTPTFTITAYAPGSPDDPSTPRRLALSRGLAVRGVLLAEGVPSARIYVRALGATGPEFAAGPPDRVDVVVAGDKPQSQLSGAPAPAPPPAQAAP